MTLLILRGPGTVKSPDGRRRSAICLAALPTLRGASLLVHTPPEDRPRRAATAQDSSGTFIVIVPTILTTSARTLQIPEVRLTADLQKGSNLLGGTTIPHLEDHQAGRVDPQVPLGKI